MEDFQAMTLDVCGTGDCLSSACVLCDDELQILGLFPNLKISRSV